MSNRRKAKAVPRTLPATAAPTVRRAVARVRSVTAAAKRILAEKIKRQGTDGGWQAEAWAMYRQVGELRYVTNAVSNATGLVELYPAKRNPDTGGWDRIEDPNHPASVILDALWGDAPTGMEQMLARFGQHLFVAGESWLVGHPPAVEQPVDDAPPPTVMIDPLAVEADAEIDLTLLEWRVYSTSEIKNDGGKVKVAGNEYDADKCVLIRVHREHPEKCAEADSPVSSSMPVLRELIGLTMKVSADIDSRLAGAGAFVVPLSATILGATSPEDEESDDDPFVAGLMESMITPIKQRDSAAAVVPIVITVPDDVGFQPYHISFATQLDGNAINLRQEAIRRLALGLDAPPERLLGMGDTNHWSAWQLSEDEAKIHVAPVVGLIRDALTRQYLRIVLAANGVPDPQDFMVGADMSALTLRPDRSADGFQLHDRDLITDDALREATGFGPEDAPANTPLELAARMALKLVGAHPELIAAPGLEAVVAQILAVIDPSTAVAGEAAALADGMTAPPAVEVPAAAPAPAQGPPATQQAPPPAPDVAPPAQAA